MRANARLIAIMSVSALALSACQEGTSPLGGVGASDSPPAAGAAPASSSTRLVDRDVEAPEVFQTTEQGLWDGRPSLGGVWAASPDAKDPERVIIRNTDNGKFVIGALFRRERDNPGPKIQISSDAADALGMIAGKPAKLNITALRRDEAPAAATAGAAPILDSAETVSAEGMDATAVSAAIDKAEAKPGAKPAAAATPAATAAAATAGAAAAAASEPPKKKHWWQRDKTPEAEAAAAPAATAPGAKPGSAAPAAVTTAPLATAAPAAKPAAAKPAAAPAAPASPAASGGKSMIQLGIFSVEANAKRAAEMVKKAGSQATVRTERSNGKIFWTVVAGPANSPAEREALMAKVQGLGFKDAYYVSR